MQECFLAVYQWNTIPLVQGRDTQIFYQSCYYFQMRSSNDYVWSEWSEPEVIALDPDCQSPSSTPLEDDDSELMQKCSIQHRYSYTYVATCNKTSMLLQPFSIKKVVSTAT